MDPSTIEPLIANNLISRDKGEGAVRPIGADEVIRRNIARKDVVEARGSLQLCAGQTSATEAAIHAMYIIFEASITFRYSVQSFRLFIIGGQEILSAEDTIQGDPLTMGMDALIIQPLIASLLGVCKIK